MTGATFRVGPLKPAGCHTCPGWAWGTQGFMPSPETPADPSKWNGVVIVGESLGEQEAASGRPFQGKAGWAFTQMLLRGGLDRGTFVIDNALRCRPPDNKLNGQVYEREALFHCSRHLDSTLTTWKPRVIVPLGEVAMQRVLDLPKGEKITPRRGWVEWSHRYKCWVIPTFHPSYIMRGNQALSGVFLADVTKAVEVASDGFAYHTPSLLTDPLPHHAAAFVSRYEAALSADPLGTWLAYDIETPYKAENDDEGDLDFEDPSFIVLRVGYAWREGEALSIPWQTEYLPLHARLLRSKGIKLGWNLRYDFPRLQANGMTPGGEQWDLMWAWHVVNSDLPKGLAFVASLLARGQARWKHISKGEPAKYNAIDAEVTRRIGGKIIADLDAHGMRGIFNRHIVQLDRVLQVMSAAGVQLDPEERRRLALDLDQRLSAVREAMQGVVPLAAKEIKLFKGKPRDLTGLTQLAAKCPVKRCSVCGALNPKKPTSASSRRSPTPAPRGRWW